MRTPKTSLLPLLILEAVIRTKNVGGEKRGMLAASPFLVQSLAQVSLGAGVRSTVCRALAAAGL
jgi:hypothetical protein